MENTITQNAVTVRGRIAEICEQCGRKIDEILIVAVTKGFPSSAIKEAVAAGFHEIGENHVQEAEPKITELGPIARYHMVGHLQSNKTKKAVKLFDVIQSVDSLDLAEEIDRHGHALGKRIECYVQVNASGERQKSGVAPSETIELIKKIKTLSNIKLTGLMTIGPLTEDEHTIHSSFRTCRELFNKGAALLGADVEHLSMGMSDDYHLAIAEGSTMIRLGTAIFGRRPAQK